MDVRDEDEFNISQVPAPFQGLNDDKIATRKRKALFLRQALCIVERFAHNPVTPTMMSAAVSLILFKHELCLGTSIVFLFDG